jgi:hypothetical protein
MQAGRTDGALEDWILFALVVASVSCGATENSRVWKHLEGAPSFRVLCERVGLSTLSEKNQRKGPVSCVRETPPLQTPQGWGTRHLARIQIAALSRLLIGLS